MKRLLVTLTVVAVLALTGGAFAFGPGGWGGGHMGGGYGMGPGMMGGYGMGPGMMGTYGMYGWGNNHAPYGNQHRNGANHNNYRQRYHNRNHGNHYGYHGNYNGNEMPFWR